VTDANNYFTSETLNIDWASDNNNMMQGTQIVFDFGTEIGENGIAQKKGDIRALSFTVSGLPLLEIGDDFGMRLTSFDEGDGNRDGSRKMIGERQESVPEPASAFMIGLGLAGLVGFRKRNQRRK
jgi:hypothetical protein